MKKLPEKITPQEKIELRGKEILSDFQLTEKDLAGKIILDIGAGYGELETYLKKQGVRNIVALEKDPEPQTLKDAKRLDLKYVVGAAENTPFKDESFDVLLSHGGPPIIFESPEQIEAVLSEGRRLLKPGGSWRMGMGSFSAALFLEKIEGIDDDGKRIQEIRRLSLEFVKSMWPDGVEEVPGKGDEDFFYILTKKK